MNNPGKLGSHIGWKIGATNPAALMAFGVNEAFRSPLFESFTYDARSGAVVLEDSLHHMQMVEAEFGFVMGFDLPPRDHPYEEMEVWNAVEAVVPVLEFISSRIEQGKSIFTILADGGINAATVVGPRVPPSRYGTPMTMVQDRVSLMINGEEVKRGKGKSVMGGPLTSLCWLANKLGETGQGLRSGQLVISGAAVACQVKQGDHVQAQFGVMGLVEARVA